ncbi:hypothetical protein XCVd0151 (plasmid) [Xanthomonas euvesicatoria pv. vesicatoria str. 85-10]|uniref:Uncharacterized protein n=1 Tax=Xanthomonas euvesicatoria pv. vesicatoria (strain 85-10) TaxID=316273 RepID=Q3BZV3_XANE5|nr:hypothetical protein XCVd0151 [Xanthomonas euvesicatoria pv. vesicatoria str. 85-10]
MREHCSEQLAKLVRASTCSDRCHDMALVIHYFHTLTATRKLQPQF